MSGFSRTSSLTQPSCSLPKGGRYLSFEDAYPSDALDIHEPKRTFEDCTEGEYARTDARPAASGAASFNLSQVTLPVTGTYSIFINPDAAWTGSLNVSVTSP